MAPRQNEKSSLSCARNIAGREEPLFLALPLVFPLLNCELTPRTAGLQAGAHLSLAADGYASADVAIDRPRGGCQADRQGGGQANEQR